MKITFDGVGDTLSILLNKTNSIRRRIWTIDRKLQSRRNASWNRDKKRQQIDGRIPVNHDQSKNRRKTA